MALIINVVFGALIGMLINYFSDVLPVNRRITRPLCSECEQPYKLFDYLVSPKCSSCGSRRSARFYIVILGAMLISILLNFFPFSRLGYWATLPILTFLGVIIVIDIEHRLVLFETSLFGLAMFFIYGFYLHGFSSAILGALGGFLIMFVFFLSGIGFSKIVGKLRRKNISEVAFGFGDVLITTVLGLLTGWPVIVGAVIIAFLTFGAFSIVFLLGLLLSKRYRAFASALPFAPFLIFGAIAIFYM